LSIVRGRRDEMEIGPLIAAELNLIAGIYRIIAPPLHIRFLLDSICSFRCLDPASLIAAPNSSGSGSNL